MKTNSIQLSRVKKIKFKTLSRKRSTLESTLVDKLNDAINESNLENSSQYSLKDDFNKTFKAVDCKGTNFFHMNISSLTYNIDQLHTLLSEININSDLIGITESWLEKDTTRTTNIDIKGYTFEHTPTETSCGGSLLYKKDTLKYICRKDLQIYKAAELESTFIELLSSSKKNTIVGCIYRHPSIHSSEFNSIYLNDLLEKLSHKNNFNIDLLKYDTHGDSSDFLDAMYASFLLPYINTPSRLTPHSKTVIDNIFSNTIEDSSISGNLVTTISNHYGQFLLMKNLNNKNNITKTEVYHQDFRNINEKRLENDLQYTSWNDVLEVHSEDVDKSFDTFFSTINSIIDTHAPLKKMSLKERKIKLKP